jgi:hypothetical protein
VELVDQPDPTHLAECAPCAAAQEAFARVGGALDQVSVPALDGLAAEALRGRVLEAVGLAPCPEEALSFAGDDPAHLEACPRCQQAVAELTPVGSALDLLPLVQPSPERFAQLKADVLAQTVGAPAPAGRVLAFPGLVARLAAAILVALTLGASGYVVLFDQQRESTTLALLEREADVLVRAGSPARLPEAAERFAQLSQTDDPNLASRARYELAALQTLQAREATQVRQRRGTATPAATTPDSVLIGYQDLLVEFPGTRASLYAIKQALPDRYGDRPIVYDLDQVVTEEPAHAQRLAELLQQRPQVLRYDYEGMARLVDERQLNDVRLRQSVILQRGLHAEELSVIAQSEVEADRYRTEARDLFEQVLELDGSTKAADLARAGLARLT